MLTGAFYFMVWPVTDLLGFGSRRYRKGRLPGGGAALASPAEHQHRSCLKQFHSPRGAK